MSSALACCPAALARPGKTPLRTTRCGHSIRATPTPTRPQGPFVSRSRPIVAARSQLEEVDPVTGEILTSPARAPLASESVEAGGITWAYRTAEVDKAAAKKIDSPPIVFLHGVGSSSFSYRRAIEIMAADGYECYAPDFPGHGNSSKPSPATFAYDEESYKKALGEFIDAAPFSKPVVLIVQGYITAQYAMLWAYDNPDKIAKMVILNTPLSPKSKLPPYLAPYKNPIAFLRPKGVFAADMHNAGGIAYVMSRRDADAYLKPYVDDEGANEALVATLDECDFKSLCEKVDNLYRTWRGETLVLFGGADRYIDQKTAFDFLETKRTSIKIKTFEARVGHMPQEDYPERLCERLTDFLTGKAEQEVSPGTRIPGSFTDSDSA